MRSILLISVLTFSLFNSSVAQRTCVVSSDISDRSVVTESATAAPLPEVIVIPVVVHIVYQNGEQNISNEQVKSQIAVLNRDFRKKNADAAYIPASFKSLAGDAGIEFRLATVDPSGLPTNGIVRKSTTQIGFGIDDQIKSSSTGGDDPWNRDAYLNIWVGNLSGGVMGYASTPGCAPEKDGVVIKYTAFGTTANVKAPYHKGRTAVHEIGHWLGLRHIWGDAACGDDKIDDTPPQQGPTRGCPSGVVATCTSGAAGNMYMNFMDFTNDECTNMFTAGQVSRMRELFAGGGERVALLYSDKADGALVDEDQQLSPQVVHVYPNPAAEKITVRTGEAGKAVLIYNHLGQVTKSLVSSGSTLEVNVKHFRPGMYYVSTGGKSYKFIKP